MLAAQGGATYWDLYRALHKELNFKSWEIGIVSPEEECPYPLGTAAARSWSQAQALYELLEAADP